MKFTQIRSATVTVDFAGKTFLIDPMLSDKGTYPGFPGSVNSHLTWPTVELPVPVSDLLNVDAVILTHFHPDHWDDAATEAIPKDTLIFTQSEKDAQTLRAVGYGNLRVMTADTDFDGIHLKKTPGRHGQEAVFDGPFAEALGDVCGVVFEHPSEKILYLAGDTVWYSAVQENIDKYKPDVIVLNSCDARVIDPTLGETSIIMGKDDVYEVCKAAPAATVIASHMEAVNHAMLSRAELRAFVDEKGLGKQVRIPADGEAYTF
jgi:L-ascorbate metabolism protein UlaG (beta-lactamase superfamily)